LQRHGPPSGAIPEFRLSIEGERVDERRTRSRYGRHAVVCVGSEFALAFGEERACPPSKYVRELLRETT
jgi:hypothetical protein